MAYLYQHIRLDTNSIFYIGIGGLKTFDKYRRAYNTTQRNAYWKNIINKTEYEVVIKEDNLTKEQAFLKETEYIKLLGRSNNKTGILCNLTDGGEGVVGNNLPKTLEHRTKIQKALLGKKRPEHVKKAMSRLGKPHSEETKLKLSKVTQGKNNPFYGKKHTRTTIEKISKLALNLETGIFYTSVKEASLTTNYNYDYFKSMVNGGRKNKTAFIQI